MKYLKLFKETISNIFYSKPNIDDDDYDYNWVNWAKSELNNIFGICYNGNNADFGGMYVWAIETINGYDGYFIVVDDENEFIFIKRRSDEEETYTESIITASSEYNNLEDLIIKIGKIIPKYNDISIKYRKAKKIEKFNL